MPTPVIVQEFNADNFTITSLNTALQSIISAVNALAGEAVLQFGNLAGDPNAEYVPKTGGDFLGGITAPSVQVGPTPGTKYNVVTTNDMAQAGTAGVVKLAAAVADLATAISNPPTQAEVTAIKDKVNALLASLRTAGSLAP
jgi:hypothetical protein